jgi:hypothetical protein
VAAADGDLIVTYGPYRRRIALPDSLLGAAVTGARLGDDGLVVSLTTTV